jgi:peptidoglycan/LPS O-acetylase OafA/YrhL
MRNVLALLLVLVTLFCAFGFMATYEPPGWPGLRLAYASVGTASVIYIAWVAVGKLRSPPMRKR